MRSWRNIFKKKFNKISKLGKKMRSFKILLRVWRKKLRVKMKDIRTGRRNWLEILLLRKEKIISRISIFRIWEEKSKICKIVLTKLTTWKRKHLNQQWDQCLLTLPTLEQTNFILNNLNKILLMYLQKKPLKPMKLKRKMNF